MAVARVTGPSFLAWLERDTPLRKVAATHGGEYAGPCPFCGGEDRFRVWPEEGRFWCRQCGATGSAIDYLRQKHNMGFREAMRTLGDQVATVTATRRPGPTSRSEKPSPPSWAAAGEKLAAECHAALLKDARALGYLHGRGLGDQTIAEFGLGWNPRSAYRHGVSLPAGWTIPLWGVDGAFYGLQVRQPDGVGPKYKLLPGSHHPLMGRLTGKPVLLVTEGAFDMMLAWQEVGDTVDVATLGSASADPLPWAVHLLSYQRILLCYDMDGAGERGRAKWANVGGVAHVRLPLAGGKDVTDFAKAGSDLRTWLRPLLPHTAPAVVHPMVKTSTLADCYLCGLSTLRRDALGRPVCTFCEEKAVGKRA